MDYPVWAGTGGDAEAGEMSEENYMNVELRHKYFDAQAVARIAGYACVQYLDDYRKRNTRKNLERVVKAQREVIDANKLCYEALHRYEKAQIDELKKRLGI